MDLSDTPQTITNIELLKRKIKLDNFGPCSKKPVKSIPQNVTLPTQCDKIIEVEAQHGTSQDGICPHCNKLYSNQSALKYHVRLVHSDMLNMFCCHLCPESFEVREFYKIHMWEAHNVRC